jgi:hypothetical protein
VDPLLKRFDDGFGLVVAETLNVTDDTPDDPNDNAVLVTFRTREIIAAPTVVRADVPWAFKPDQTFAARMSLGVSGTISSWYDPGDRGEPVMRFGPPAAGARFVLSVRPVPQRPNGADHADGPGAAEPLLRLPEDRRQMFAMARQLASLPEEERLRRCRSIVTDRKANDALRREAVRYLAVRCIRPEGVEAPDLTERREAERTEAAAAMWAAWNDPLTTWSDDSIAAIEAGLRLVDGNRFDDSDDRRATLLNHVLAPPPEGKPEQVKALLSRRPVLSLAAAAGSNPSQLGWPLVRALGDERWPVSYRVALADVLLRIREYTVGPEPGWVLAVEKFVTRVADRADPDEVRLVTQLLSFWIGSEEGNPPRRPIKVTGGMSAAMRNAERSIAVEATRRPDDLYIRRTVNELRRLVRFAENLEAANNTPPALPPPARGTQP